MRPPQGFASSAPSSSEPAWKAAVIEHEGEAKAGFIAAQGGLNRRVESASFDDYELAASWIRKRTAEADELEDRVRDAP